MANSFRFRNWLGVLGTMTTSAASSTATAATISVSSPRQRRTVTRRNGDVFEFDEEQKAWRKVVVAAQKTTSTGGNKTRPATPATSCDQDDNCEVDSSPRSEDVSPPLMALPWRLYAEPVYFWDDASKSYREITVHENDMRDAKEQDTGDTGVVLWDAAVVLAKLLLEESGAAPFSVLVRRCAAGASSSTTWATGLSFAEPNAEEDALTARNNALLLGGGATCPPLPAAPPPHFAFRDLFRDRKVVELGAGTGFAGIAAAASGLPSSVVITDLPYCVENMQRNIHANGLATTNYSKNTKYSNIEAKVLDWSKLPDCRSGGASCKNSGTRGPRGPGPGPAEGHTNHADPADILFEQEQAVADVGATSFSGAATLFGADILWVDALLLPLVNTIRLFFKDQLLPKTAASKKYFVLAHQTRSRALDHKFLELLLGVGGSSFEAEDAIKGKELPKIIVTATLVVRKQPEIKIWVFEQLLVEHAV